MVASAILAARRRFRQSARAVVDLGIRQRNRAGNKGETMVLTAGRRLTTRSSRWCATAAQWPPVRNKGYGSPEIMDKEFERDGLGFVRGIAGELKRGLD
ncbi:hypothetical protein SESBI_36935 [Sesbania bispinosa]|nr:hypothetical protein SESBI_36935 [Sesbania bispinosa]